MCVPTTLLHKCSGSNPQKHRTCPKHSLCYGDRCPINNSRVRQKQHTLQVRKPKWQWHFLRACQRNESCHQNSSALSRTGYNCKCVQLLVMESTELDGLSIEWGFKCQALAIANAQTHPGLIEGLFFLLHFILIIYYTFIMPFSSKRSVWFLTIYSPKHAGMQTEWSKLLIERQQSPSALCGWTILFELDPVVWN